MRSIGMTLRSLTAVSSMGIVVSVVVSSCGGGPSMAGTSSSNCVDSLSEAIAIAPVHARLVGVREVKSTVLSELGFSAVANSGNGCLIGFSITKPATQKEDILYVFELRGPVFLGRKIYSNFPIRLRPAL